MASRPLSPYDPIHNPLPVQHANRIVIFLVSIRVCKDSTSTAEPGRIQEPSVDDTAYCKDRRDWRSLHGLFNSCGRKCPPSPSYRIQRRLTSLSVKKGTALKASVRFLTYDTVKNTLSDPITGKLNFSRGILAGALAGCVESILAVTPTERIKTALIDDARSSNPRFRSSLHCTRLLLQEQGLSSLYKGLLSTTLKQSATSAVRMGSYNILKQTAQTWELPTKNAAVTFGMGAIAGTITVYATQPFDTIKTRSQSAKGESTLEAFRGVLKDRDGIRGFWKGSTMRLGRLVLSGGIVFSVYESVVTLLSPGGGNN